jgi:hypothetical protein
LADDWLQMNFECNEKDETLSELNQGDCVINVNSLLLTQGWSKVKVWCALILVMVCNFAKAQSKEQLWLDYQIDYPFANRYLLEVATSYQTLLSKNDKWRSISLTTTFEALVFNFLDVTADLPIAYTVQKEGTNTYEFGPIVGLRFYITQSKRIDTRVLLRYQQRYFRQVEQNDWDVSNRTRLKAEAYICINGPNLFTNKLWYVALDYEEFIVLDEQLEERYANRRRAKIGLNYRLSYKHRFDISYTLQSSRNEIEGDFISNDNVIQLRYRMFFNSSGLASNSTSDD